MQHYNMKSQGESIIKKRLIIGNTHQLVSSDDPDNTRHEWILFIKFENDDQNKIGEFIKQVIIHLHPTFKPSEIKLDKPPFRLRRTGW